MCTGVGGVYSLLVLARHLYATVDTGFFLTAVLCLQWQIIGCIDDVMKLAKSTLLFNSREPSILNIKMNWSKTSGRRETVQHRFWLKQWIPLSALF